MVRNISISRSSDIVMMMIMMRISAATEINSKFIVDRSFSSCISSNQVEVVSSYRCSANFH